MNPAGLFAALGGVPRLEGARCLGRWEIFDLRDLDDPDRAEIEAAALAICSSCPARRQCADHLDSLPPSRRPTGVVGGCVVRPPVARPRGRPRTTVAS